MFAGKLGLSYRPETNQVVFIVSSLENPADWDTKPWDPDLVDGGEGDTQEEDMEPSGGGELPFAETTNAADEAAVEDEPEPPAIADEQAERSQLAGVPQSHSAPFHEPVTSPNESHSELSQPSSVEVESGGYSGILILLAWVLPLFPALFAGIGLGMLAGLIRNVRKPDHSFWVPIFLGVAVIYGIKLLFHVIWRPIGVRVALGEFKGYGWVFASAVVITVLFLVLEALLGANALVQYSLRATVREEDRTMFAMAFPIAIAVTSPILLSAAFIGFREGREKVTADQKRQALLEAEQRQALELAERRQRAQELELLRRRELEVRAIEEEAKDQQVRRELEAKRLAHEADLARREHELRLKWEEEDRVRQRALQDEHREELARKEADRLRRRDAERSELDSFRKHPDYVSLMQSLGRINVLRIEIERLRKEVTSFKISRGYDKMEVQ